MEQAANRSDVFLPYLYSKIEELPSILQEEVLLFTDFLHSKNMDRLRDAKINNFDKTANGTRFADLSLSSLSKEWDTAEDKEWDTVLSQISSIQ